MNKQEFIKLLEDYLSGNVSDEQKEFLEAYYLQFSNDPDGIDSLEAYQQEALKDDIKAALWERLELYPEPVRTKRFYHSLVFKVAASVILLVSIIGFAYYHNGNTQTKSLAGNPVRKKKENSVVFLPDGSKVILSAGSRLNYPSTFNGAARREVFLTGEAFFDIAHNPAMPFVVHTDKLSTEVLGTAFNIKAYNGDGEIAVTVTRGKVQVKDKQLNKVLGVLTPNQQIVYDKSTVVTTVHLVDTLPVLTWKNEDLFCNNLTMMEVADLLNERYKVDIFIDDPSIRSQRFTTTFNKHETLENILNSICEFNSLTYAHLDRGKIILKEKK